MLKPTGSLWLNLGDTYRGKRQLGHPVARRLPPHRRPGLDAAQQRRVAQGQGRPRHEPRQAAQRARAPVPLRAPAQGLLLRRRRRPARAAARRASRTAPSSPPPASAACATAARSSSRRRWTSSRRRRRWRRSRRRSARSPPAASPTSAWSSAAASARRTRTWAPCPAALASSRSAASTSCATTPAAPSPATCGTSCPRTRRAGALHFAPFPADLCRIPILATCPADGVVLDPFCGTGTAMLVAAQLGRRSVGIDLAEEYLALARERTGVALSRTATRRVTARSRRVVFAPETTRWSDEEEPAHARGQHQRRGRGAPARARRRTTSRRGRTSRAGGASRRSRSSRRSCSPSSRS